MFLGAKSTLTTTPSNTAVLTGNTVTLHCTSSVSSASISWSFGGNAVVSACVPQSDLYSVNSSTNGQCDLIVNNANSSLSGFYQCVEFPSLSSSQCHADGYW
jgi:hypothetical protein